MRKFQVSLILMFSLLPFLSFGQGSTYTGTYASSARIEYVAKSNLVIEGKEFKNTDGRSIVLWSSSDIIIRNCKFTSSPKHVGIYLYGCKNITIENCTFENLATALLASTCTANIKFEHNDVKNILGSSQGGDIKGSMVQFIRVSGAGHSISYNACENISGESAPEDLINMNDQSSGTPESPIIIANNWIRGGGPSGSGGGINLGDVNGSYQTVENNILVDPGQYGIAISGGHHNILRNNKVYAKKQSFTNVGIVGCNWYEDLGPSYDNTIANNEMNYTNSGGQLNNWWIAGNMGTVIGMSTNVYNASLSASILPTQILGRAFVNANPTYVWNQKSTASFTVASNWTPARTNVTTKDVLQFNAGGSVVVTNMPNQSIGQLQIQNNSTVEIRSSSLNVLTVNDLSIAAGSNLKIGAGGQISVVTSLTNDGNLYLLSDKTNGTASILTPVLLGGTGIYNIQQYLTSATNCHISSPITLATASSLTSVTSLTTYNEVLGKWESVSGTLSPLKGFLINLTDINGMITFNGKINNGNIAIPLTRTPNQIYSGYNMLGNPYPSYVNLNNMSNNEIEPTIWYRSMDVSPLVDVYNLKSGVSTSNTGLAVTGVIAPMQAFFVRVRNGNTSSTFSMTNAMRTHRDLDNNVFRAPSVSNASRELVRLTVSNGTVSDETVIYADASASNSYDDYDSGKRLNAAASLVPNLYTTIDDEILAINGMNSLPLDTEIPITFASTSTSKSSFTIKANEIKNLANGVSVILKDMKTGSETNLTDGLSVYEFSVDAATVKSFSLIFRTAGVTTGLNNEINSPVETQIISIYKNSRKQISVKCNGTLAFYASVAVFNSNGEEMTSKRITGYNTVVETALVPGEYNVIVNNGPSVSTKKITIN